MGDISENLLVQSKNEDGGARDETKEKKWKVLVTGYGVSRDQLTSIAFRYDTIVTANSQYLLQSFFYGSRDGLMISS